MHRRAGFGQGGGDWFGSDPLSKHKCIIAVLYCIVLPIVNIDFCFPWPSVKINVIKAFLMENYQVIEFFLSKSRRFLPNSTLEFIKNSFVTSFYAINFSHSRILCRPFDLLSFLCFASSTPLPLPPETHS